MVALECSVDDIPNLDKLAGRLNGRIPSGGSGKGGLEISRRELDEIISRGSNAMVDMGYAYDDDLKISNQMGFSKPMRAYLREL